MSKDELRAYLDHMLSIRYVVANEVCEGCGAPICPECGDEAMVCRCCGQFNCDRCGHYLVGPRGGRGGDGPEARGGAPSGPALVEDLLRRVQNETDG
jgi:hypothetical protein